MERGLKILHLEDEPWDSEWIGGLLRKDELAAEMERVDTMPQFQQALERGGHDLILSDFTVPGMDVLEALCFARERRPELPFVFVSGTLGEDAAIEALKLGATDYVLKQRVQRLAPAVRRALQEAQERAQRKRIEAELHAREEWLRLQSAALQSAANAISITDREGSILWVNPAFERLTGYSATELLGQNHRLLKSDRQDAAFYRKMWDTITAGRPWHGEVVNKRKDGRLYNEEMTIAPVTDARGAITHFVAIKQDVTGRKSAEAQLQQSEERHRLAAEELQAIMDAAPAGILVAHDPECHLITGNRPAHEVLGVPLEEENISATPTAQGASPYFRIYRHGREASGAELPMQVAGTTGTVVRDHELEGVRRDGTRRTMLVTAAPLYSSDGRLRGAVGALVDITERKQAEEALRESEEQFRALAESMPQLVWTTNAEGQVDYVNDQWRAYTGHTAEEACGSGWSAVIHPEDRPRTAERWAAAVATGQLYQVEYRLRNKEGHYGWFLARGVPLRDAQGRVHRWFGTCTDIDEQRRTLEALQASERRLSEARDQLARANKGLERQVDERTARLREIVAELEQISYSMIHDLRAPLRAIQSFGGIVAEDPGNQLTEESRELIQKMRNAADRMDRLVVDVLNYSRVVQGGLPRGQVDVGALVREIVDTYPNLRSSGAEVRVAPDCPLVLGNTAALMQCLSQLLDNAVRFARPGEVPRIKIRGERQGNGWVRIVVEDNGIGIPPELREKVFGMFQRLSNTGDGTGMGLAIVKKAVERMGGRVGVESEPGRGSRFWMELKAAAQPPGESAHSLSE